MTRAMWLFLGLALAGCASAPPAPAPGLAQIWGQVDAPPPPPLIPGDGMNEYRGGGDEPNLPEGAELVDYSKVGPLVVEARPQGEGSRAEAGELPLTIGGQAPLLAIGAGGSLRITNSAQQTITVYAVVSARRGPQVGEGGTLFEVVIKAGETAAPQPVGDRPALVELYSFEDERLLARVVVCAGRFALVDGPRDVRYVLDGLQPGRYEVLAWHPRLPGIQQRLTLGAGDQQRLDLRFGVASLPKVDAD